MSYTPTTAAQNTAALAGVNQAALAAPLTALAASIAGGNLAPAALFDALLSSVGFQAQDDQLASASNTTSTTLVDANAAYADYVFVAPIAKTYVVHVDLSAFVSAAAGFPTTAYFGLKNTTTGTAYQTDSSRVSVDFGAAATILPLSFRVPVAMNAGNNTLRLMWRTNVGTTTINANTNCRRCFTVTG